MVQDQGGLEFQSAGILSYFEELKRELNTEIDPKDIFEMAFSGTRLFDTPSRTAPTWPARGVFSGVARP